jgi:3-hydroxyacyl-CoA dehydrogenase
MIKGIKKITCVGSGLIGQGWAALYALNGYEVVLQDVTEEKLSEAGNIS